jgi:hypothetical protein
MTKDEALKLALEALEHAAYCVQKNYCPDKMGHDWDDTIASIKEALAQPVQEAAAFIAAEERKREERYGYFPKLHPSEYMDEPAQRTWVGLTDEDITKIDQGLYPTWKDEVQAVEAKLKEKNT